MNIKRVHTIINEKGNKEKKGPIIYWMSREQRIDDNWALIYAQEIAKNTKNPLIIVFSLVEEFDHATLRAYKFMIEGLEQVFEKAQNLNIPFMLKIGKPEYIIPQVVNEYGASALVTDFSPLREKKKWNKEIKKKIKIPFYEVDAHNIIPVWVTSNKKEYAAYTIRKKIKKHLYSFLTTYPPVVKHKYIFNNSTEEIQWDKLYQKINVRKDKYPIKLYRPGENEARSALTEFINLRFLNYNEKRNDPTLNAASNLSPYLHFGHISSQRVVLETSKIRDLSSLKSSFYDEIIVRKELSDNFCYFEPQYDTTQSFPDWGKKTLDEHKNDIREYVHTVEEFDRSQTHDELWNAAQNQMVVEGKMHNYLRMYWAKKILEWTASPEDAMQIALMLNNTYELDGRDPNGYAGVAWSIGGVHDRAWKERPIFGKIRYMTYNGIKRKFPIKKYIEKYQNIR